MELVVITFIFNVMCIIIFAIIYRSIDQSNFIPLKHNDKLTMIDYLFYSTTIQSGVGLPDITAITPLAKVLAIIQQLILMGSALFILRYFIVDK
jgi:hypothetical protein